MIARADNKFAVTGELTMGSAKRLRPFPFKQCAEGDLLVVDMAQVGLVDSAAVSLMLSWLRQAKARVVRLSFIHVPANLHSLVELYGLSEVLSLNYS